MKWSSIVQFDLTFNRCQSLEYLDVRSFALRTYSVLDAHLCHFSPRRKIGVLPGKQKWPIQHTSFSIIQHSRQYSFPLSVHSPVLAYMLLGYSESLFLFSDHITQTARLLGPSQRCFGVLPIPRVPFPGYFGCRKPGAHNRKSTPHIRRGSGNWRVVCLHLTFIAPSVKCIIPA